MNCIYITGSSPKITNIRLFASLTKKTIAQPVVSDNYSVVVEGISKTGEICHYEGILKRRNE